MKKIYKFYWSVRSDNHNFGDVLTPHILKHFDISFEYSGRDPQAGRGFEDVADADAICVGSIARFATDGMLVLGSGVIRRNETSNPKAIWKFVRGPYTRENVIKYGGTCPAIYGDPALLLPLFCPESEKQYDVGIVPHYNDYKFVKANYPNHKIINVQNKNPLIVAKEITKCKKIISSSLHGIICAHAYKIPAAWVRFSNLWGDGIKFTDHYASLGLTEKLSTVNKPIFSMSDKINLDQIIKIFEGM